MDDIMLVKDVDWSRKHPCGDCPFLRTSPFHWGVAGSLETYASSIDRGIFAHTCHKTDNRKTCDGPRNHDGQAQHCVGAILMLLKTGNGCDLQLPLLQAAEAGKIDIVDMSKRAEQSPQVFTWLEMLRFYLRETGKLLKRKRRRRRN